MQAHFFAFDSDGVTHCPEELAKSYRQKFYARALAGLKLRTQNHAMSDNILDPTIRQLAAATPMSPEFLAARDRLQDFAEVASRRLGTALREVAALGCDQSVQNRITAQVDRLRSLHEEVGNGGENGRSWLARFGLGRNRGVQQGQQQRFVRNLEDLASGRDQLLRQELAIERSRRNLGAISEELQRAADWLERSSGQIERAAMQDGSGHHAKALRAEVMPALQQGIITLTTNLALAAQANLALNAMTANGAQLAAAIDAAMQSARSMETMGRAIASASQRIRESEQEAENLTRTIKRASDANGPRNANLIDGVKAPSDRSGADHLGRALDNLHHSLRMLDAERDDLARTAAQLADKFGLAS